jgi:lipid A 3-O-deacylase
MTLDRTSAALGAVLLASTAALPAAAQDTPAMSSPLWGLISEVRVSVANHDVQFLSFTNTDINPFEHKVEEGLDVGGAIFFTSPAFLDGIWSPRPYVQVGISTAGDTNHIAAGLDWEFDLGSGLYAGGFLGLAYQDGYINEAPDGRLRLGSPILFHFGADLGYRIDGHWGLSLFWEHMSNGAILGDADSNQGMDNVGIRVGYRFD